MIQARWDESETASFHDCSLDRKSGYEDEDEVNDKYGARSTEHGVSRKGSRREGGANRANKNKQNKQDKQRANPKHIDVTTHRPLPNFKKKTRDLHLAAKS